MRKVILFLFLIFVSNLFSQELNTKSRKAKKLFEEANSHLTYGQYFEASEKLKSAIASDPNFIEAYLLLGDAARDMGEIEEATHQYIKAIELNPDLYPRTHYFTAKLLMKLGRYEKAESYFQNYVSYEGSDEYSLKDAKRNILNCQFAKEAILNPVDFEPINLGQNINSIYSEYFPSITVDGEKILYTRLLGQDGRHQQEDFYISIKGNNGKWVASQNLGRPINTQMNEGAATISADGKTIIFTACEQYGNYGPNRSGYGSCDLFFTRRIGNRWSDPVNLGPPINTSKWESQPSLSADGECLYFVRGKTTDGRRESDIMVSMLDVEGYWSKPIALSENINTEEVEGSVFIHPDNRTIYFSSNGHIGMGGSDLFMSQKDANGEWGKAINLGFPINTHSDENSLLVGPDGEIGFFASDRPGGFGGLDIYGFKLPEEIQADPVTYFKGIVYDSLTQELLAAKVELIDADNGLLVAQAYSSQQMGSFFLTLIPRHNYVINVSKDGYLFYSDGVFIKENFDRLKPYEKDIPLLPLQVGNSVVLKNIFFETDKSNLKAESEAELQKLKDFLVNNPSLKIEIGGHTDNEGSYEYNQTLSEDRAKAVFEYLTEKGISSERLSFKGYSFDKPLANNETKEGRAKNRRTEFKIIEIK
jgi:outer membrane protein OmpA-like peptidoglycan-associated protein/tetratricopeptide (TPR) repeat protein